MYSSNLFLFLLVLTATILTVLAMSTGETNDVLDQKSSEVVIGGRFLAQQTAPFRARTNCDKYPRVCVGKGSVGPDCCKKKCVNVMSDQFNCGKCGKKCKYLEICCQGRCVNLSWDERHCGKCNHKCNKGNSCRYGMCSYA